MPLLARMSDNDRKPPGDESDAPPDDTDAPPDETDAAPEDEDAPESGEREADDDEGPVEGDDPSAPPLDPAVVRAFLGSKKARDVAKAAVANKVPAQEVEDLVFKALGAALEAPPPHVEAALVSWMYKIAARKTADWVRKRTRRKKYEGAMPERAAREDDYTGESLEDDDGDARGYEPDADEEPEEMLGDHLDRLIGDNAKEREVRDWIRERADGKTYKQIAAERGLTEDQIASRIRRLKVKYAKPIKRRRDRMLLLWLLGGGAAIVAAAAILYWLLHREPPRTPSVRPPLAPSATATTVPEGLPVGHPPPPDDESAPDARPRE